MGNEIRKLSTALETPERPCFQPFSGASRWTIPFRSLTTCCATASPCAVALVVWRTCCWICGLRHRRAQPGFLKKELGKNWASTIKQAKTLIEDHGNSIHLPVDLAANIEGNRVDIPLKDFPIEAPFGTSASTPSSTSRRPSSKQEPSSSTPAGVFEDLDFALGTIEMLNACAESDGYAIMSRHTATLVKQGLANKMGTSPPVAAHASTTSLGRPLRR